MRIQPDWINGFLEYSAALPSPEIFRKWSAIAAIAGALERRVWVKIMGMELYPNLYTVLVGPPGVGKTVTTSVVETFWRALGNHHVAPKSVSRAAIIDSLNDATRTKTVIGTPSMHLVYNSLLVHAGELGVLLPDYSPDFMHILTDLYDCRQYDEKRRTNALNIVIKNPQLNILAACTPSYLNTTLPEGAWDQGFLSRTFIVFSGERVIRDLFLEENFNDELFSRLKSDFRQIGEVTGLIKFDPEAAACIQAWHKAGGPPAPDHPKLVNYLTRRTIHLVKLCMVSAMSRSDKLLITVEDYQRALDWLLEMEANIDDVFRAMGSKGDGNIMEETYHFIFKKYMATKQPVLEHVVVSFVSERAPSYNVMRIIELMEKSNQIVKEITPSGRFGFKPLGKSI